MVALLLSNRCLRSGALKDLSQPQNLQSSNARCLDFGLRNFLVDVQIPGNDHFTAVPGEHLFQQLFGR